MTSEPTITCPKCKEEIRLTESLAAPLVESVRRQYEERLEDQKAELDDRLRQEKTKIAQDEAKRAKQIVADDLERNAREIADLKEVRKRQDEKLAEAQKAEAGFLRQQRELDEQKREMDLTIEKRIREGLATTRDQARKEAEEGMKLQVAEREKTIQDMKGQIEDLKRKAEQGSQQLQGEVQELELEALLKERFPHDTVEPVPKGEHGGDVLHRVVTPTGRVCGTVLWESKRTKSWSDGWLSKLRGDQRAAKAEVAVIISQTLPKGVETFELRDEVWIAHPGVAVPLAMILRHGLIEVTAIRQASEGQQTKMGLVYEYLTGPRFRQRIQAIMEAFKAMEADLASERKALMKQWAKREVQISNVIEATAGMYGDLQGIAGKTLREIEGLDLKALEAPRSKGRKSEEAE